MFSSLYVHVPFCHEKCDYCAFYSLGRSTTEQHRQYLDKLKRDFQLYKPQCAPLKSVFFGGGTPTALDETELDELTDAVRNTFILEPDCEWSCETTPDSLSPEKIQILAHHGVNRVSIGIQSFIPEERNAIGRKSSIEPLPEIFSQLKACHIDNVNVDLIFLIPGQTPLSFIRSLNAALAYNPAHISTYALTLEPRSPLARRLNSVDDTLFQDFWDAADTVLASNGLHRYEISNFARPHRHCRHNNDIWHGATYLGCGPAATSFDGADRFTQPPSLNQWLDGAPPERDTLPKIDRAREILAFGMRTAQGWNWNDFTQLTSFDPMDIRGPQLQKLASRGLLNLTPDGAAPTRLGMLFNDDVLEQLI